MVIGFSSVKYTTTESEEVVEVCVDVLNPPSGGALEPFTVSLLTDEGITYNYEA